MKRMLTMLTYAIIAYAMLIIFMFVFQRSYLYFPDKETIPHHYFDEFNIKEIRHTTDDGLALTGWYKEPGTKNAKVFFSVVQKKKSIVDIESEMNYKAKAFRKYLGQELQIKFTPKLRFFYDETISYNQKLDTIFNNLNKKN